MGPSGRGFVPQRRSHHSECSLLDQVLDRILSPLEHDTPVTITESNETRTRRDAGFCEQAERQLYTSLVIDMKFGWFSDHEESVALSLSENVDRLGL